MGKNERKVVELDDYEYRVMIEALADRRNDLIDSRTDSRCMVISPYCSLHWWWSCSNGSGVRESIVSAV